MAKSPVEPTVRYVLAEKRYDKVTLKPFDSFAEKSFAKLQADSFNRSEQELGRIERRPVRTEYVVLEATTSYKEL